MAAAKSKGGSKVAGTLGSDTAFIAKDITLEAMKVVKEGIQPTAENAAKLYGKLYKLILKQVRDGVIDERYD